MNEEILVEKKRRKNPAPLRRVAALGVQPAIGSACLRVRLARPQCSPHVAVRGLRPPVHHARVGAGQAGQPCKPKPNVATGLHDLPVIQGGVRVRTWPFTGPFNERLMGIRHRTPLI